MKPLARPTRREIRLVTVPSSDSELVAQALAGSQPAYSALVARYSSAAVNFAARIVRDRALAEDLAQDAFVRAFARLSSYDQQRKFSSWFLQIVHNITVDYVRRRRVETVSLDELTEAGHPGFAMNTPGASPAEQTEQAALGRALARALETVRPEYRAAVVLRYQEGLSHPEIAEIMGVPVGTVKTHLHRARKELALAMSRLGWSGAGSETAGDHGP